MEEPPPHLWSGDGGTGARVDVPGHTPQACQEHERGPRLHCRWENDLKRFLDVSDNQNALSEVQQVWALISLLPEELSAGVKKLNQDLASLEDVRLYVQRTLSNHGTESKFPAHKTAPMDCTPVTDAEM